MRPLTLTLVTLTLLMLCPVDARLIIGGKSFQEMFDKADLVIIATAQKTKDTPEKKKLIDIQDATPPLYPENLQDPVIGVETEFRVRLCLKGPKDIKRFVLHHYRLPEEDSIANGPAFIRSSAERHTFLMFVVREKDGRYAPVTGQFDPAVLSVLELHDATPDAPQWWDESP